MKAFWKLTRLEHGLLLGFGAIVGAVTGAGGLIPFELASLVFLCPFFIELGSFAINDYFDLEADKINMRTDRPLVTQEVQEKHALAIALFFFPAGVITAAMINFSCFLVAFFFAVLSFYYSWFLKKIAILGNLAISFSMAIPFAFGSIASVETVTGPAYVLALSAFLLGFGREILKSIQDMKGDVRTGRRTLPILIGKKNAAWHATFFMLLSIIVLFIPFIQSGPYYLDPVFITFAISAAYVVGLVLPDAYHSKNLKRVRTATLLGMALALFGFFLGALV